MRSWRVRCAAALRRLAVALACAAALAPAAAADDAITVRYRSADAVYLSAGSAAGLAVGDAVEVVRGDQVIARLEVVYVAERSASCRVVTEQAAIREGDAVRRLPPVSRGEPATAAPAPEIAAPAAPPASSPPPAVVAERPPAYEPARRERRTSASGSLTVDWEDWSDDEDAGLDYQRTTARLNLRGRDLGGRPLELRVRARSSEIDRERAGGGAPESESRDRLYELSLTWAPDSGRFRLAMGRLGASPFVGIGFLDGVVGEVAAGRRVHVGAFAGSRPEIAELGFESLGERYGLYTRFHSPLAGSGWAPFELLLGGVREDGETDVSREYALVELRYAGSGRWSFRQRAEIDVNRGWREEVAGSTTQLSNLSLSAAAKVSTRNRFVLSYNRFQQYRTEETRFLDDALFDDFWRQGLRGSFDLRTAGGLGVSLSAGLRSQEGGDDDTVSFGLGVNHFDIADRGLSAGLNVLAYSGELAEGLLATARTGKRFRGGHSLNLALGHRISRNAFFDAETTLSWARLGFWLELPGNLFAYADYEQRDGDGVAGALAAAGLGYRF